jgi:hypothetical protein
LGLGLRVKGPANWEEPLKIRGKKANPRKKLVISRSTTWQLRQTHAQFVRGIAKPLTTRFEALSGGPNEVR